MLLVKIHEAYRTIVAVCDPEIIGKYFEEGKMQIKIKQELYEGEEKSEEETIDIIKEAKANDAIFNFVGEHAVETALKSGIIDKEGIIRINKIPHALSLL